MIQELTDEQLPDTCAVFKHSTRCPVSSAAAAEVRAYSWPIPLYWVNVIEQRPLSHWVRDEYGVQHESPQLIFLKDGEVAAVLNHGDIEATAISRALGN